MPLATGTAAPSTAITLPEGGGIDPLARHQQRNARGIGAEGLGGDATDRRRQGHDLAGGPPGQAQRQLWLPNQG